MRCPHCNDNLDLDSAVLPNVDIYNNIAIAKALCCGKGVVIHPIRSYRVEKYTGTAAEDHWGEEFE